MSKLDGELLAKAVDQILAYSKGETVAGVKGKVRNFRETIELQIALRNYDPNKDKRFNGTFRLPTAPRPDLKVCMLGDEKHLKAAKEIGIDVMSVDDLKKMNKNKKLVRKMAKKYDAFLASGSLIKQIPRLLGPGLNRAGKFPALVGPNDDVQDKVDEAKSTVKFQLKKALCLCAAVAHVRMTREEAIRNTTLSINFMVSLLKKNWQNVGCVTSLPPHLPRSPGSSWSLGPGHSRPSFRPGRSLYVKSSMGPVHQVFF
jgi:large subunit ribosomal protein L10Ae